MVSYQQLSSGQVVLHERETSSSGRPKAQSLQQEDADFFYGYDSRGGLIGKIPKSNLDKFADWHEQNVKFAKGTGSKSFTCQRITPLSPFESAMGVRSCIPSYRYDWCKGYTSEGHTYGCQKRTFNEKDWEIFKQTHTIDYGNLETIYTMDMPVSSHGKYDWASYFKKKASEQNLEVVSMTGLNFRERQKPAVVEKVRPNPKEESIASVKIEKLEPIEIEPIKEAVKYSPLMIAGILIVIVLFLKRGA